MATNGPFGLPHMNLAARLLERHEGRWRKPYVDTVGKTTIGVGRNLTDNGVDEEEIDLMLSHDLSTADMDLMRYGWYPALSDHRKAALLDMMFNLGASRFAGFKKMIAAIARDDWEEAGRQARDSKWAEQVGPGRVGVIALMLREG